MKEKRGITLVALVVTIVVLLILAGVSLNLVLGNNGIVKKAREARIETRAATVEDEVAMWKDDKQIAKESGGDSKSQEEMLQDLKERNLVYEDEIDEENETINITDNYGNVVKQISYGIVKIEITETPANEQVSQALLYVSNIENLSSISKDEVSGLNEENKKEIVKLYFCSLFGVEDFEKVLNFFVNAGVIKEAKEDNLWAEMNNQGVTLDDYIYNYMERYAKIASNGEYQIYEVINPQEEKRENYEISTNGTYSFKVKDLLTNKTYTEKIDVSNIIEDDSEYYISLVSSISEIYGKNKIKLASTNGIRYAIMPVSKYNIVLKSKVSGEQVTFDKAYCIKEGEKVDISSYIKQTTNNEKEFSVINAGVCVENAVNTIIIEKDGVEYTGYLYIEY